MASSPRHIIIDTDPGQDDAVTILLALASPELTVDAITTVAGNVAVEQTARNACALLELAKRTDVPVYAGAERPLRKEPIYAANVHGETGMGGANLPPPVLLPQPEHAVDALIERLTAAARACSPITLVCLGPLTNIATALTRAPECLNGIEQIVAMGGAQREGGNITPTAEFNFFVDPDAADIVMKCGRPITLLPLDVTHRAIATPKRLAPIAALHTPVGEMVTRMLGAEDRFEKMKYGWEGGALHDPLTLGWLLRPEFFSGRHCNVTIECTAPLCLGQSIVDYWSVTTRTPNALWVDEIDAEAFYSFLAERLGRLK
ncbi:inosine-uridine preferring nucleoside hydrolase [Neokomagataea thailandica NBRC 106555]|uniref:Nucleoside hydrolase n=2 Tax=Neokomagataea TaxID=1223423 RepID=A0A4Y6V7V0_9PROT|nr:MULTISPECIES: nucleoside hydrolase [Neokomagataea]QDH24760.1 nucleoside hydrolase [Neokomagataea tanensis]GBR53642.1 inosine-uridine preferring nucleoside hydrolase [Neokomagataea thailandica NBRC 106555]